MASYDKLVKYLAEKLQAAASPLADIIRNQEIIIGQNKQIINLLTRSVPVQTSEAASQESIADDAGE